MDRRKFIKKAATTAVVGAAASTISAPALSAGKKQWIAVSAFGKAGLLGQALEEFAKFVGAASQGRLTIKPYHAGELVKPFEALDAVQSGTAQMGYGAPYYWAGKSDSISFVAAMPYGMTAQEQNAWAYYGGGIDMADKAAYNPLGLKFLPMGNTGNQMGGWYAKQINTVADLKGLKFRMPGLGGEILKTFGVNVVLLPGSEVLPALTSGAIDGTEWIGPAADMGKGLYKVVNNYYYPGWHEPGSMLEFTINIDAWDTLPPHLQAIVTTAAKAVNQDLLDEYTASNNRALQDLIENHDVQLRELPKDVINEFRIISEEILETSAANDPDVKKVYDSFKTFLAEVKGFHAIAEDAFVEARTNSDGDS